MNNYSLDKTNNYTRRDVLELLHNIKDSGFTVAGKSWYTNDDCPLHYYTIKLYDRKVAMTGDTKSICNQLIGFIDCLDILGFEHYEGLWCKYFEPIRQDQR